MAAHFGSRLRKGAASTAVAAVAVAALSASQAPGAVGANVNPPATALDTPAPDAVSDATGSSPYYTDLPPLHSPAPSSSPVIGTPVSRGEGEAAGEIPATVLDAYKRAEAELRDSKPGCNLPWQLLAAIGKVESGQARGGRVDADGTTIGRILGPQLDGNGFALIKDTDHGAYDGNAAYDQAIGPMQFIPSTWAWAGRDGNSDGKADPNNVYDAALAAGHYLCRGDRDLSRDGDLRSAILSYNNSTDYLNLVLNWVSYYRKGVHTVPDGTGGLPTHRSDETPAHPAHSGTTGPSAPAKPTKPAKPGKPAKPTPPSKSDPGTPAGGDHTSTPKPPTPTPPWDRPTATDTVDHLAYTDPAAAESTAMAGHAFTGKVAARAETKDGKAVPKVRIRFTITGDTDATFAGGETVAAVTTDVKGVATAPALQAGEKTGAFKITTALVGRQVKGVDYKASVTPRAADALAPADDKAHTCVPGGEFADAVQVKATYKGAVADRVEATATLIKADDDPAENDKGPYFKGADDKPVRTLTGLKTDDKGLLTLPKLYADDTAGTYLLRITTTGGATLTVQLTVAPADGTPADGTPAADDPVEPSPSPSATS
ncbi:lytic transglycosylase domain-containing protein [Streptomyces sp. NPDC059575]|uniref:lytic transglycosylase domain-containing protein n=1 Tax=Streptomyces sp. NPDC059575 TaxID=3346872 RepID=UPI0036899FC2